MNIRPIRTRDDYAAALSRIEELMNAEPESEEGAELDVLATLVDAWETRNFIIEAPDPVAAIEIRMEQLGVGRKELEQYLGGRNRVSEVLNRKRGLSIAQIRKLHAGLKIPLESLIGQ